ncbi:MAG: serine/threonine protein kinase [Planctomycetes bacterium]|nr:serine/threonine protein kinase [Planctomycetota bacterium]
MNYTPLAELGRSTCAIVYRAQDEESKRTVVLKVLTSAFDRDPEVQEAFRREASITARLAHANIITLLQFGRSDGKCYLVTEFVNGRNVRDLLRTYGRLAPADALYIAAEAGRGLAHAHGRKMVHRNIKPSNILVAGYVPGRASMLPAATVKILDFGLGKSIALAGRTSTAFAGSPHYISPEQIRGDAIDGRTDLYGLGMTLYEMLTGTLPFRTGDIFKQHLSTVPPPPSLVVTTLPKRIDDLVLKCLEKDPAARFPSAEALVEELTAISGGE